MAIIFSIRLKVMEVNSSNIEGFLETLGDFKSKFVGLTVRIMYYGVIAKCLGFSVGMLCGY